MKNRKKTAHQIYREAKDKNLNDEEFKEYLKKEGVIVSKESLDRTHQIAQDTCNRIKQFAKNLKK